MLQMCQSRGARVDVPIEKTGMTPMHWASTAGHIHIVRQLALWGCSLDPADEKGTTPLMIAAQYGRSPLLCWLARQGANTTCLDSNGDSALHWAAYKGLIEPLEMLCKLGLRPELQDAYGSNCLHLAAGRLEAAAVAWLLRHESGGAMERALDQKGRTPLEVAASRQEGNAAVALLRGQRNGFELALRPDGIGAAVLPAASLGHAVMRWLYDTGFRVQEMVDGQAARGGRDCGSPDDASAELSEVASASAIREREAVGRERELPAWEARPVSEMVPAVEE